MGRTGTVGAQRRRALGELAAFDPPDAQQARLREEFTAHVRAYPDALARSGPPAHLTASCLVLDVDRARALLVHHAKALRWFQPGGHVEPGDAGLAAAAAREAREETGLAGLAVGPAPVHLDRHELVGAFGRCREHLDVRYLAIAPPGASTRISAESLDLRWFAVDQLPDDDPSLVRLVQAGVAAP